jgi:hypothetical protein
LVGGKIESIRFETDDFDAEVLSPSVRLPAPEEAVVTYGAVEGRIQSMTNRRGLRFTLYDLADDHAVSCYLREDCEDTMRHGWGKMAVVEGLVRRDPQSGRITTVREIQPNGIQLVEPGERDSWREAIGCAPATEGGILPEEAVRRGRDQ